MQKVAMCLVPDYRRDMTERHRRCVLETYIGYSIVCIIFIKIIYNKKMICNLCSVAVNNQCLESTIHLAGISLSVTSPAEVNDLPKCSWDI